MVPKIKKIFLFLFVFILMNDLYANVLKFNPSNTSVEFLVIGNPSAIKIKGEKAKVYGDMTLFKNNLNSNLKVDLNEFTTGIEMRDEHMKEKYLETQKAEYRYAQLSIIDYLIPEDYWNNKKELNTEFNGKLTLHGVTKNINGRIIFPPYTKGNIVLTNANFNIKLTEFNIEIPSFVGITVAEEVKIEVKLPLELNSI